MPGDSRLRVRSRLGQKPALAPIALNNVTKLSIQSRHGIENISIHLRPGQSCTFGSGAAADFTVQDRSLAAVHCRISCRNSGGYIECLEPGDQILINQAKKNRSRLTHGTKLQIGTIELDVEMPEVRVPTSDFHVNFEEEDAPSTVDELEYFSVADAVDELPEQFDDIATESTGDADSPNRTPEKSDSSERRDASDPAQQAKFSFEPLDDDSLLTHGDVDPAEFDDYFSRRHGGDDDVSPPVTSHQDDDEPNETPKQPEPDGSSAPSAPSAESSKPREGKGTPQEAKFSFDSGEPDDVRLSESELQAILPDDESSQHDSVETFPTMSVSFADAIESDSDSISTSSIPDDIDLSRLDEELAENDGEGTVLPGGQNVGKFYRWQNRSVQPAIDQLTICDPELAAYRCKGLQTELQPASWVAEHAYLKENSALLLLTRMPIDEVQNVIRTHRWDDRMGHPQALRMFLEYAPRAILEQFFSFFDSVLLIEDGDATLMRKNQVVR